MDDKAEALRVAALLAKYGTSKNGHSHFAPSASAGWLNCAGFLLANAKAPDDAGIDAAYGTVAHHVADRWQKMGEKPVKLLGRVEEAEAGGDIYKITIDEAMMEFVEEYVNWCNEVPGEHFYEQKVQFGDLLPIPNQGGTADHFAIHQLGLPDADDGFTGAHQWWLTITDLKMGTGVRVYAEGNTQAGLYALGVFREYDWMYGFAGVTIRICQPRLNVFETWTRTRAEMMEFEQLVKLKSREAWHEGAPRTPSPKACQWCKVAHTCAARLKQADDLLDAIFTPDEDEPGTHLAHTGSKTYYPSEVTSSMLLLPGMKAVEENKDRFKQLSTTALSYTLTFRRQVEKMFAAMAEELLDRAEKGQPLPFQSLKDGRMTRDWSDKSAAEFYLIDELGLDPKVVKPPGFISVAEAEKVIRAEKVAGKVGPKEITKLLEKKAGIRKMAGKRTLADLKDDRPDVFALIDQTFDAEEDEDDL